MTAYINSKNIISVLLYDEKINPDIIWKEGTPNKTLFFGLIKRKGKPAGFCINYSSYYSSYYVLIDSKDLNSPDIRVDYFNKKVYNKPYIKILTQKGESYDTSRVYFNTIEEAKTQAEKIFENIPHVIVENIN